MPEANLPLGYQNKSQDGNIKALVLPLDSEGELCLRTGKHSVEPDLRAETACSRAFLVTFKTARTAFRR